MPQRCVKGARGTEGTLTSRCLDSLASWAHSFSPSAFQPALPTSCPTRCGLAILSQETKNLRGGAGHDCTGEGSGLPNTSGLKHRWYRDQVLCPSTSYPTVNDQCKQTVYSRPGNLKGGLSRHREDTKYG